MACLNQVKPNKGKIKYNPIVIANHVKIYFICLCLCCGWFCFSCEKSWVNSLSPETCVSNFQDIIFKLVTQNIRLITDCKIALRWMPENLSNAKSTLVQVMAWCCQAASHYLNQCSPRSLMPYCVARPQWVNSRCWNFTQTVMRTNVFPGFMCGNRICLVDDC